MRINCILPCFSICLRLNWRHKKFKITIIPNHRFNSIRLHWNMSYSTVNLNENVDFCFSCDFECYTANRVDGRKRKKRTCFSIQIHNENGQHNGYRLTSWHRSTQLVVGNIFSDPCVIQEPLNRLHRTLVKIPVYARNFLFFFFHVYTVIGWGPAICKRHILVIVSHSHWLLCGLNFMQNIVATYLFTLVQHFV